MQFSPDAWKLNRSRFGSLDTVLIQPAKCAPASLIVLSHGYGASGSDLLGLFEEFLAQFPDDKPLPAFLFPEAPIDLSDQGMFGSRAWWPLNMAQFMLMSQTHSFDQMRDAVPEGVDDARDKLCACIRACCESNGWSDTPLVLGGFSQGAILTVDAAIRGGLSNVIGLIVFSGALICETLWRDRIADHPLNLPLVQSHGRSDPILPIETGRWLHGLLRDAGCTGELLEFDGPHTIPYEAITRAASRIV
jgi:phospholipase/carboxylesterase